MLDLETAIAMGRSWEQDLTWSQQADLVELAEGGDVEQISGASVKAIAKYLHSLAERFQVDVDAILDGLPGAKPARMSGTDRVDLETAIAIGKSWSKLGWAVQDQLQELMDGADWASLSESAVVQIVRYVRVLEKFEVEEIDWLLDELDAAGARIY